jgi:putative ABC transport system substrate-binding protein
MVRVAALFNGTQDIENNNFAMLVRGLAERGYVQGANLTLDVRYGDGVLARLPQLVHELLERKPDVVLLQGSQTIWAARKATSTIPIVMVSVADPVGQGLIASLARPGGNLTGFSIATESDVSKRLQLLREVLPKASRFAYFTNLSNTAMPKLWDRLNDDAKRMGMALDLQDCQNATQLDAALAGLARHRPDGVLVEADALLSTSRRKIIAVLLRHKLPSIWASALAAPDGAFMSYGSNFNLNWREAGRYIDRIVKGASPAELPVEQPTHVQLIINQRTAKHLGVVIPQAVLARADWVIE